MKFELTPAESDCFKQLLQSIRDKMGMASYNDFNIKNTPRNVKLLKDLTKFDIGDDEKYLKPELNRIKEMSKTVTHFTISDFVFLDYLMEKIFGKDK